MKWVLCFQNDFNVWIQQDYFKKFICGFVVYVGFIQGVLWEIECCVEELGLQVLCLFMYYMDFIGYWNVIFNEEIEFIFELANYYKLVLEIYFYDGEKFILLENMVWCFYLIWMFV